MATDSNNLPDRDDNTRGAVPISSSGKGFNYLWLLLLIPLLLIPFCTRHQTMDTTAVATPTPDATAPAVVATPAPDANGAAGATRNAGITVANPFVVNTTGPDMGKAVVNFEANNTVPNAGAITTLNGVVTYLQANPSAKVSLKGFTDSTGTAEENKRLTAQRINNVKSALTGAGVDAGRIATANFGEAYPVTDNSNPQAREMNRRVEIELAK